MSLLLKVLSMMHQSLNYFMRQAFDCSSSEQHISFLGWSSITWWNSFTCSVDSWKHTEFRITWEGMILNSHTEFLFMLVFLFTSCISVFLLPFPSFSVWFFIALPFPLLFHLCFVSVSRLPWVSSPAYPNLLGTKRLGCCCCICCHGLCASGFGGESSCKKLRPQPSTMQEQWWISDHWSATTSPRQGLRSGIEV
jgi:hypothetical protein